MKPLLLDTYCKAGGAGYGFSLAGFDVVGVDKEPQPNYPFKFYQGDAVEFIAKFGCDFDHIHSSPPCQFASVLTPMEHRSKHKNWIPETREALIATGKLYDIENVENARRYLINPIMLCGSMFGLGVWRHRYFELHPSISLLTPTCNHGNIPVLISGTRRRNNDRFEFTAQQCRDASGLFWMTRKEMDEAIPPAYTHWLGSQVITRLAPREPDKGDSATKAGLSLPAHLSVHQGLS
jgi:DNA (cytosine-5)-methyltransferase 1